MPLRTRAPLCLLLSLLLTACASGTATGQPPSPGPTAVVASNDGLARLSIPPGALPAGHRIEEIRVTNLGADPGSPQPAGSPGAIYKLEPDGLQLAKAATLSLTLPGETGSVPVVTLESSKAVEIIGDVRIAVDLPAKKTVLTFPIKHFSQALVFNDFFVLRMSEPGKHFVRESFSIDVSVSRTEQTEKVPQREDGTGPFVSVTDGKAFVIKVPKEFQVQHGEFIGPRPIISPERIDNAPSTAQSSAGSVGVTRQFQCVQEGSGAVAYHAVIKVQESVETFLPPNGARESLPRDFPSSYSIDISAAVACVPAKLTAQLLPPSTIFTVTPAASFSTFKWTGAIGCGTFTSSGPTATWTHPNVPAGGLAEGTQGAQSYCPHSEVPNFSHPGTITVVLSGPGGNAYCTYSGSLSGEGVCARGNPPG